MCGICGVVHYDRRESLSPENIQKMTNVLAHRGPDGEGLIFVDGESGEVHNYNEAGQTHSKPFLGLGHRRLKVIDLVHGDQPMTNEDGTIWLVFNGEIYNYQHLRERCESKGHQFSSHSDTEAIIHLYEEVGVDCLDYLEGMFAFALWDSRKSLLFIARDRLGQKPLYYYEDGKRLVFASEIKAIIQDSDIPQDIDPVALHHYLTYLSVPAPLTIYQHITKLLPGHYLLCQEGRIEVKQYWDVEFAEETADLETTTERLRQMLQESVRKRLVSDVPLGAFLSGGVDSSAVVAMMSQMQDEPVKTFSIGFEAGEYYNELGYARQVAECFGTEHREFTVSPNMVEDLPKLVWHWDEPFAVSSAIPVYYLSRMAREFVTVVMSGDGADEQFAGYSRYQWDLWSERLNVVPRPLLTLLKAGVDLFPSAADAKVSNQVRRAQRYMDSLMRDKDSRYVSYFTFFDEVEKSLLYTKDFGAFCNRPSSAEVLARHYMQYSGGDLNRRLYGDIKTTLPDEMLTKVDRMSMAVGLEVRSPFMDHQLVEYVATLPARFKLRGKVPKFILKKALEGLVPDNILYRPKHGFEVPIDDWLRGSLKEYALDHLSPSALRKGGIFNPDYVEELLKIHMSGYRNLGHKIWILLVFQVWQKVMQRGYA